MITSDKTFYIEGSSGRLVVDVDTGYIIKRDHDEYYDHIIAFDLDEWEKYYGYRSEPGSAHDILDFGCWHTEFKTEFVTADDEDEIVPCGYTGPALDWRDDVDAQRWKKKPAWQRL